MKYGKEKQREHVAMVRQIVALRPDASIQQVLNILKEKGVGNFSFTYVWKLKNKVLGERATRFERKTKEILVAEYQDFLAALEVTLMNIAAMSKNDMAKVLAVKTAGEHRERLIQMAMDIGLLDRNLGTLNIAHYDMATIAKAIADQKNKNGPSTDNPSDTVQ